MAMITPLRMTLGDLISPINRGGETRKKNLKKKKKSKKKKRERKERSLSLEK